MATYSGGRLSTDSQGLREHLTSIVGTGVSRLTKRVLRRDVAFGGNDHVAGVVEINSVAKLAKVRLHDQVTGLVVAGKSTDAMGVFRFDNLSPTLKYYITAFDPITGEQAVIFDRI